MTEGIDLVLPGICGLGLHMRLDGFRLIYVSMAALMWGVSGVFSLEYMAHYNKRRRYYWFFWVTLVATAGVFLSADLYTTFLFFEVMSFTSYVWVAFDERQESLRAAQTYLAVAVIGGMVMLMGLFLLYDLLGTLEFDAIGPASRALLSGSGDQKARRLYIAGGLLLFGFGAKAGMFPMHIWLPKAHPAAPAPASALLSGILTKTGIFGIIVVSCRMFESDGRWGLILAGLGLVTMFLGALLALLSMNIKRTLACSSVSQIGFILTGIAMTCLLRSRGEGDDLAVRGAFLHMINHSLFKLVLFLCAGIVFMNLHKLELNEIRGFGRKKPAFFVCFTIGALGMCGIPGWSGYISKTLLHESIVEYIHVIREGSAASAVTMDTGSRLIQGLLESPVLWTAAEWLFLVTGGMTVAYMLKLFAVLFVERHPERQEQFDQMAGSYIKPLSRSVLLAASVLLLVLGLLPYAVMNSLADLGQGFFHGIYGGHGLRISYFSFENLKGSVISAGIGIVLYMCVTRGFPVKSGKPRWSGNERCYMDPWPQWLDLENLVYRPVIQVALPGIFGAVFICLDRCVEGAVTICLAVSSVICRGLEQLADSLIVLARNTTHRQCTKKRKVRKEKFGDMEEQIKNTGRLIEESFSFGLLLFCVGLCLTLGYLLIVFFRG